MISAAALALTLSVSALAGAYSPQKSGGEPLEQALGLVHLLELVRGHLPDFSIGLFSGNSETELDLGDYLSFPPASRTVKREWSLAQAWLYTELSNHGQV